MNFFVPVYKLLSQSLTLQAALAGIVLVCLARDQRARNPVQENNAAPGTLVNSTGLSHELQGPLPREVSTHGVPGSIRFKNVARESGIDFVLENCPTKRKYLPETMPGGIAAFDYNGDGLTDLYFTNGASVPLLKKDSPRYANRLYRNLGNFKFEDVTEKAHVAGAGYSMGVAAADYDNDGHVDLFVAGVGRNILYHNLGNGSFEDVTGESGIKDEVWSVGAAWFDYDNDGLLDLFVVNYLKWSPSLDPYCGDSTGQVRVYCHPKFFDGLPNRLYHNQGNGVFKDVSIESGIGKHIGKGMAAAIADYDHDGFSDIFITNDKMPNFLFHNLRNGKFEEVAFPSGVAMTDSGAEISNMGADFRDFTNDGLPDLAITALSGETFPLFRNQGKGQFRDIGYSSRMASMSQAYSGWSLGVFDFDNDGWKDIFTANSHANDRVDAYEATEYKQHNSVFLNAGNGVFRDVSQSGGLSVSAAHRGCAFADFDNDGRVDVAVSAFGEPAELWRNVTPADNTWIVFRLSGTRSNRDGIGARIQIGSQYNHMTSAVGYASSSHFGVHFGTGSLSYLDQVTIDWPRGVQQQLRKVRTNQILKVDERE